MICPEDTEHWRPVPIAGYDAAYEVSDYGRVRRLTSATSTKAGHILIPTMTGSQRQYATVKLSAPAGVKQVKVHRLVLLAFVGPCPSDAQGCHWNGCHGDNHVINLRWGTAADNTADKLRHGTQPKGEHASRAKLTADQVRAIRRRLAAGEEQIALGPEFGITQASVSAIWLRKSWRHIP